MINLSVVICTFNRANLLQGLLNSLANQQPIHQPVEVIIVDNASTDSTKTVVDAFKAKIPGLRYVFEKNVGLSRARNRGWQEAKGKYVGYLDDDALVPPEWLRVALEVAENVTPDAFGGPYYAFYNSPKPGWFKDEYASNSLGNNAFYLGKYQFLTGGNMFILREYLTLLGGFSTAFGMSGDKLAYGEESKFFVDLRHKFPDVKIFYEPKLFIHHLVRPEKMTFKDIPRRWFLQGVYSFRIWRDIDNDEGSVMKNSLFSSIKQAMKNLALIARLLLWSVYTFSFGLLFRNRKVFPYRESYLYVKLNKFFMELGRRVESIRQLLVLR